MHKEHLILCGEIKPTAPKNVVVHQLKLSTDGGGISLDVAAITKKMVNDLPNVLHDLLEIASYIYVADQAISRGGLKEFEYAEKWNRLLHFKIPVREYDVWSDPNVREILEEALSFASGDTYIFEFVKQRADKMSSFLNLGATTEPSADYNDVILFSGGLDSFTGAVDAILGQNKHAVLVSHQSHGKMTSLQQKLHEYIVSLCGSGRKPLHIPVTINKDKRLTRETSQRTRSFLYASLGTIVANMFKLNSVKFYENGIVSCNLSFDGQTPQARATRSTHPKFLNLLSKLMSELLNTNFVFENPYFSKTKTEVCLRLKELQHAPYILETRSCASSIYQRPQTHCGTCSQCIDRRFANLASDCGKHDPDWLYALNIFTDSLDTVGDRAMAAGFVGFAAHLAGMTADGFVAKYPSESLEIARQIPSIPCEQAMRAVFDLHRRHAEKVNFVMETAIAENKGSIVKGTLPNTCLISMVASKAHLDIAKLLKKKTATKKKHAKGELETQVDNLLKADPNMSAPKIAEKLDTSASAVRQTSAWKNRPKKKKK